MTALVTSPESAPMPRMTVAVAHLEEAAGGTLNLSATDVTERDILPVSVQKKTAVVVETCKEEVLRQFVTDATGWVTLPGNVRKMEVVTTEEAEEVVTSEMTSVVVVVVQSATSAIDSDTLLESAERRRTGVTSAMAPDTSPGTAVRTRTRVTIVMR